MIVVLSGRAMVSGRDGLGDDDPITSFVEGHLIAGVGQLAGRASFVDARAETAVEGLIISAAGLRALVIADAELGERIMRALILRRVGLIKPRRSPARSRCMTCTHLGLFATVKPSADGCEECLKLGQKWIHLRICRVCGHVGCCDESIGKHATKHFKATGHPVMEAYYEPEGWGWCYIDEAFIDLEGDVTPHPPGWVW